MAAVRNLLGRCGIGAFNETLMNQITDEPADKSPESDVASDSKVTVCVRRTSSLSCINLNEKYTPEGLSPSTSVLYSLEQVVPELLESILSTLHTSKAISETNSRKLLKQLNAKQSSALQKFYDITKKGNEQNRVPLLSVKKWNVIGALSAVLIELGESSNSSDYDGDLHSRGRMEYNENIRLICWTLNNLSIPYENKATMALSESSPALFKALTLIIHLSLPSAYLCVICFFNLTFLADAIQPVILYVPPSHQDSAFSTGTSRSRARSQSITRVSLHHGHDCTRKKFEDHIHLLENPASLLLSLERILLMNAPYLLNTVVSVQGEAIRWTCGLIRNVTLADHNPESSNPECSDSLSGSSGRQGVICKSSIEKICALISQTEIPKLLITFVINSPYPTFKWTKDSLEDISLGVMCNLAQWPCAREALKRAGAVTSLEKIEGLPGIHGYRARAIRCSLGALPVQCSY